MVRATKTNKEAAHALLYELPGVFCVVLRIGRISVRLLKEADQFRIMKKQERSEVSLTIHFEDRAALGEVCFGKVPLQKSFAEGRVRVTGYFSYFAVVARVNAEADRLALSEKAYADQYGRRK